MRTSNILFADKSIPNVPKAQVTIPTKILNTLKDIARGHLKIVDDLQLLETDDTVYELRGVNVVFADLNGRSMTVSGLFARDDGTDIVYPTGIDIVD